MLKTAIVIPIKTNNQRLPGKNTKNLNGRPLYDYLFNTVKKCKKVDNIYIDSSSDEILSIAESYDFETIKRPESLNTPETSGNDLLNFELQHIESNIICQVFVTLPFIEHTTIDKCISELSENSEANSVLPLYEVYDRFWCEKDDLIVPANHNPDSLVGTQYMKPILRECGFYVFKKKNFLKEQKRVTKQYKVLTFEESQFIDIDTKLDFVYAEAVAKWKLER
mgnify:FL=1